jgi:hypothetical protein
MCAPGSELEREGASPSLAELPANNESNCELVMARGEQLEVNR